jgi:hypothetical protein
MSTQREHRYTPRPDHQAPPRPSSRPMALPPHLPPAGPGNPAGYCSPACKVAEQHRLK